MGGAVPRSSRVQLNSKRERMVDENTGKRKEENEDEWEEKKGEKRRE